MNDVGYSVITHTGTFVWMYIYIPLTYLRLEPQQELCLVCISKYPLIKNEQSQFLAQLLATCTCVTLDI